LASPLPLEYTLAMFVCGSMLCASSDARLALIAGRAALGIDVMDWCVGDQGAKPIDVGSCSASVHASARTAVTAPLVGELRVTLSSLGAMAAVKEAMWCGSANMSNVLEVSPDLVQERL
jgi:hypothetical protein